jgi:hypothetical protein
MVSVVEISDRDVETKKVQKSGSIVRLYDGASQIRHIHRISHISGFCAFQIRTGMAS